MDLKNTFLAAVLSVWALSAASAAEYALLVGIDEYQNPSCTPLTGCATDCAIMRDALLSCGGGWTAGNVATLLNSSATVNSVLNKISIAADRAEAGDVFVFFQSSHGEYRYLCCYDDNMSAASLGQALRSFKSGVKVLCVIDTCYSGSIPTKGGGNKLGLEAFVAEVGNTIDKLNSSQKGPVPKIASSDIGWCTAAAHNQLAMAGDVSQGSYFTYSFVSGLKSGSSDADCFSYQGERLSVGDADGNVTATEAFYGAYGALADYYNIGNTPYASAINRQDPQIFNEKVCDSIVLAKTSPVPLSTAADTTLALESYSYDLYSNWLIIGAGWLGQAKNSYDGVDSLVCSPPFCDRACVLRTVVKGPGRISFAWKVSSLFDKGNLAFRIDGWLASGISGIGEWQSFECEVDGGEHELEWEYSRISDTLAGENCGWIDRISWKPSWSVDVCFDANGGRFSNGAATKTVAATPGKLWGKLPMPMKDGQVFVGWYTAQEGGTLVTASSLVPDASTTFHARWTKRLGLAEGSEWPYAFTTDCWCGQSAVTHDGRDALRSGIIYDGQNSYLQTKVTGAGTLSFWWKVSCEGGGKDALRFLVDSSQKHAITGETDWTKVTVDIAGSGTHTLKWNYTKNGSVTKGEDFGWIDQINWQAK